MQTLSRYFVAFLLLLVSSFLEESKPEKESQQVSLEKIETNWEQPRPEAINRQQSFPCS